MHLRLGRRLAPLTALLTLGLVVGVLGVPSAGAADKSSRAAADALEQVQSILEPSQAEGRDLTMALRELRLHQDELSATDRALARRVQQRPSTDVFADFGPVRVHWQSTDPSISVAWINLVGTTSQQVLATYAAAGYRAPKSDGVLGGTSQLDVYVVALDPGLYGYCDTDVPPPDRGPYDVAAYCAFDNDYVGFPRTPEENLKVTAAHELFHAVQFAYDYEEDRWFLEATATWAEDELFDDIDDNRQYLAESPMRQPRQSLDQFIDGTLRQYGEWIFFRYLTERWPEEQGGMPLIVRRLMERVDGASGGPDLYSIKAVEQELRSRGTTLHRIFADFADANRRPQRTYEEGSTYRAASPSKHWNLTAKRRDTRVQQTRINHLASATMRFTPGAGLAGRWRLRIGVGLPNRRASAVVSTYRADGRVQTRVVRVDRRGLGQKVVRFDRRTVDHVEVTLVNASTLYKCWGGSEGGVLYSCRGNPLQDRQRMLFRARAVR